MPQIEMKDITLPAPATIKVELSLTADIHFTAYAARRRVNNFPDGHYSGQTCQVFKSTFG